MTTLVKEFTLESLTAVWESFLRVEGRRAAILDVATNFPDKRSVVVSYSEIARFEPELADYILERPKQAVFAAENAMQNLLPANLHAPLRFRVARISAGAGHDPKVGAIRHTHLHKLLAVHGMVRKVTEVRPKISDAVWQCQRCGAAIEVSQDGQTLKEPLECYEDQGGCKRDAAKTKFVLLTGHASLADPFEEPIEGRTLRFSEFADFQLAEIQEPTDDLRGGEEPRRLSVHLHEDLAGVLLPGDDVVINGILRERPAGRGSSVFDLYLEALSIEVDERGAKEVEPSPADEADAVALAGTPNLRDKLIASVAPTLYGLEDEKLALLLQQFGGVTKILPDGTHIRGDIHEILVGDPGLAKSQLLRYMAQLAPRGMYASGKSASAAGLTAAVVLEEAGIGGQRWTIEGGLLVLADRGLACVDEFDKMSPQDRDAMHQAMEQQVISINKAGVHATLMTRTSILAAANPKLGRFDRYTNKLDDIDLPPAILSRFDFVISMSDRQNKARDRDMAAHVVGAHRYGEALAAGDPPPSTAAARYSPPIEIERMRRYIAFAKRACFPQMTDEAAAAIQEYYVDLRARGAQEGAVPATPRQLDGYVRLAEAAARMRLSSTVDLVDVDLVRELLEKFMRRLSGEEGILDIDLITTGTSSAQRQVARTITDAIANAAGGMSEDELMEAVTAQGVPDVKVRDALEKLSRDGRIYLNGGRWRVAHK